MTNKNVINQSMPSNREIFHACFNSRIRFNVEKMATEIMAESTHFVKKNGKKSEVLNKFCFCLFFCIINTFGNVRRYVESNDKTITINIDDIILTNCVRPPTRCCTAERDNDAQHGKQRKNDENILAVPNAINS